MASNLERRVRAIQTRLGLTEAQAEEREHAAALERKLAFMRTQPQHPIHVQLASLARAYIHTVFDLKHPEVDAPDYHGPRIEGPLRSLDDIEAEFMAKEAECQRLADVWWQEEAQNGTT